MYWTKKVDSERSNPRQLWKSLNILSGDTTIRTDTTKSAEDFARFFEEKVDKIHSSTNSSSPPTIQYKAVLNHTSFTPTSVDEVKGLIAELPSKQCDL